MGAAILDPPSWILVMFQLKIFLPAVLFYYHTFHSHTASCLEYKYCNTIFVNDLMYYSSILTKYIYICLLNSLL